MVFLDKAEVTKKYIGLHEVENFVFQRTPVRKAHRMGEHICKS